MEGLSCRELADVIGIPSGTVMSRRARAREALRGAVDEEITQSGQFVEANSSRTGDRGGTGVTDGHGIDHA